MTQFQETSCDKQCKGLNMESRHTAAYVNPGHWSQTQRVMQIQAAEMRVLRLIKTVTRIDRLRNDDVRTELK